MLSCKHNRLGNYGILLVLDLLLIYSMLCNFIVFFPKLIIRLKDIKNIYKDKTAKIIPNAISVLLENEKYFFTSFVSRDKTYTTLFRVWQMALANSVCFANKIYQTQLI